MGAPKEKSSPVRRVGSHTSADPPGAPSIAQTPTTSRPAIANGACDSVVTLSYPSCMYKTMALCTAQNLAAATPLLTGPCHLMPASLVFKQEFNYNDFLVSLYARPTCPLDAQYKPSFAFDASTAPSFLISKSPKPPTMCHHQAACRRLVWKHYYRIIVSIKKRRLPVPPVPGSQTPEAATCI